MKISKFIGQADSDIWVNMGYRESYTEEQDFIVDETHSALLGKHKVGDLIKIPVQKSRPSDEQPEEIVRFRLRNPNNRREMIEMTKYFSINTAMKLENATKNLDSTEMSLYDLTLARVEPAARMVKDWDGFTDDNDQPIPFSHEALVELLMADQRILLWLENEVSTLNAGKQPAQEVRAETVRHIKKKSKT